MSIKKIIDEWDPVNLLSHAPQNEYHTEIDEIEKFLKGKKSCDELAEEIYAVFMASFGDGVFKNTKNDCLEIAEKIIHLYNN